MTRRSFVGNLIAAAMSLCVRHVPDNSANSNPITGDINFVIGIWVNSEKGTFSGQLNGKQVSGVVKRIDNFWSLEF